MTSLSKLLKGNQLTQVLVLLSLLVLLVIGAVPGYLTGQWQWKQPASVSHLNELRQIRQTGLTLPGWQIVEQNEQQVGTKKWSLQVIKKPDSPTQPIVLLLPQSSSTEQPEEEWSEINSWGRSRWGKWNIAQYRSAAFTFKPPSGSGSNTTTKVDARFFRASTPQESFAVLQWYALPDGGHPSLLRWFLADQLAQWRKQRTPWVGVSIFIPIEPLGQVETAWSLAQSLGETVQVALMAGAL